MTHKNTRYTLPLNTTLGDLVRRSLEAHRGDRDFERWHAQFLNETGAGGHGEGVQVEFTEIDGMPHICLIPKTFELPDNART